LVRQWVRENPDATLEELAVRLKQQCGLRVSVSTISRLLTRMGLPRKKSYSMPASGTPNASASDLISTDLSAGEKGGYKYDLQATPAGYTINANPTAFNNTGSRTFYSDQSLTIRQNFSAEPATIESPEIK